jgi:hypothetical protein
MFRPNGSHYKRLKGDDGSRHLDKKNVLSSQRMANVVHPHFALVLPAVHPRSNYPQQAPQPPNQLERQTEVHKIHHKA